MNNNEELKKININIWKLFNTLEEKVENLNKFDFVDPYCVEEKTEGTLEIIHDLRRLCCLFYKNSTESYERQIELFQAENCFLRNQVEELQKEQRQLQMEQMRQMEVKMEQLQVKHNGGSKQVE